MSKTKALYFLLFVSLSHIVGCFNEGPGGGFGEPGDIVDLTTIPVLVDDTATLCQMEKIISAAEFFEKVWGKEDVFKIYVTKANENEWSESTPESGIRINFNDFIWHAKSQTFVKGLAHKDSVPSVIWQGTIKIDETNCWNNELYVHEFAHLFSLDHEDDETNIMRGSPSKCNDDSSCFLTDEQVEKTYKYVFLSRD